MGGSESCWREWGVGGGGGGGEMKGVTIGLNRKSVSRQATDWNR